MLEKSVLKWKAYYSDCYCDGEEYVLLLEDFTEAVFLPGSNNKEFFTLHRYQQELGKDFKRITLYLATKSDFHCHEAGEELSGVDGDVKMSLFDEPGPSHLTDYSESHFLSETAVNDSESFGGKSSTLSGPIAEETQIRSDHDLAKALQDKINREEDCSEADNIFSDSAAVVKALQKQVVQDECLLLTVRRGISLSRVVQLWQRERKRKTPLCRVSVKYLGEDGIDTGALAREFFTDLNSKISKEVFPNGSPVHSTLLIQNGYYRSVGELVATSIAQNGPPPCFLEEAVFETLVNYKNVDPRNLSLQKHLTPSEREQIESIKENVESFHDTIIEHGYTGLIRQDQVEDIVGSMLISIVARGALSLGEFMEGLDVYGLKDIIFKNQDACRSLFVKGKIEEVDANYLIGLLKPQFSEGGSNKRAVEEHIVDHFQDFLLSLEDDGMEGYASAVASNYDCGEEESTERERFEVAELSVPGVLKWLTGRRHRDITGSGLCIVVNFNHTCKIETPKHTICFPYVGACGMEITLPVAHIKSYEEFKDVFIMAFSKGQSFGKQ